MQVAFQDMEFDQVLGSTQHLLLWNSHAQCIYKCHLNRELFPGSNSIILRIYPQDVFKNSGIHQILSNFWGHWAWNAASFPENSPTIARPSWASLTPHVACLETSGTQITQGWKVHTAEIPMKLKQHFTFWIVNDTSSMYWCYTPEIDMEPESADFHEDSPFKGFHLQVSCYFSGV